MWNWHFLYRVLHYINLLFDHGCNFITSDHAPHLWIQGTESPIIAKQEVSVYCHLNHYWFGKYDFTWRIGDHAVDTHHMEHHIEGNVANNTSVLRRMFRREEDASNLTCSFSAANGLAKYLKPKSVTINLLCKWIHDQCQVHRSVSNTPSYILILYALQCNTHKKKGP